MKVIFDYPTIKNQPIKKNLETSKANYNILSNITLDKQNFLPPEKRPIIKEEVEELKPVKINGKLYKDYDIISNNYKFNNEEKIKADYEISQLNAAKNFWKARDYDFFRGRYIDDKKEEEFQLKRSKEEKEWGKHNYKHNKQQEYYNLLNNFKLDVQPCK